MKTVNYTIPSIHCMHCAHAIKLELGEINGVSSVEVDIQRKIVTIQHDEKVEEGVLVSALTEINYPPVL